MANISYAQGTISFKGFTKEEIDDFIKTQGCSKGYGIENIDIKEGKTTGTFYGNGRWTFESTLENLNWLLPKGSEIHLNFTDEESGNGVYYIESGTIYDNGEYVVNNIEILSLEETLDMSEFDTVLDLMNDIENLGWSTVKEYENGDCPSIWEIENEDGEKRKINIETVMNYDKLAEELENE